MKQTLALITRPAHSAQSLAKSLKKLGFIPIIAPMIQIQWLKKAVSLSELQQAQGLIFTSIHGVQAFTRNHTYRNIPVYTIGDATAKAAKNALFKHVLSANGNTYNLLLLLQQSCQPQRGTLLHMTNEHGNITQHLNCLGFQTKKYCLYKTQPLETLPKDTVISWQKGLVSLVLLFSPYTAQAFLLALERACCYPYGKVSALCLSRAISKELCPHPDFVWRNVAIAARPRLDALLDLLKNKQQNF